MSKENTDKTAMTIAEEVTQLLGGAEVSAELQEKMGTVLEAVVSQRVATLTEELKAEHEKALTEAIEANAAEMEEVVDRYIKYAADEWMAKNELAVKGGIQLERAESFMAGLKDLFENHWVEVPEGKEDILETAQAQVSDLQTKLDAALAKNAELHEGMQSRDRKDIVMAISADLTDTQAEKLAELTENVEFTTAEQFEAKAKTLRETFIKDEPEANDSDKGKINEDADDKMSKYLTALRG